MPQIGLILYHLVIYLLTAACGFFTLREGMHMFQLSAYQYPGYLRWLSENMPRLFSVKRLVPVLFMLGGLFYPFGMIPFVLGAGLFLLLNRPGVYKKPLVFTGRMKRLLACSLFFFTLFFAVGLWLSLSLIISVALVLLMPFALIPLNAILSPIERAIANTYIKEAKAILKGMPSLLVIGVTGSYGKTSVKTFLYELLSSKYNVFVTPGNYNTTLGVTRAVREGLKPVHDVFICEMGARHIGDIDEICQLTEPDIGVVTAVAEQHLETFFSLSNVLSTKLELYFDVRRRGGACFINADSAPLKNAELPDALSYGEDESALYRLSGVSASVEGLSFTVHAPDGTAQLFQTKLLGRANAQNLLAALSVCHHLGIPLKALAPHVRALKPVRHRLELLNRGGGMLIIDDSYNANPQGALVALETLRMFEGFVRAAITPGLVELGERQQELNVELGRQMASCCDIAMVTGPNAPDILRGLSEQGFSGQVLTVADAKEGVAALLSLAQGKPSCALLLNDLPDNYS